MTKSSVNRYAESPAFNPAERGTLVSLWDCVLEHAPTLSLPRSSVVVVSPHPDDEVLGAGGLIHAAARSGCAVTLLSVTDGEAAYLDWPGLGLIRRRELNDALSALAPGKVAAQCLSIPDGHVDQHRSRLCDALERRVSRQTLLVAPYEFDGHPDHDATGEVCRVIARRQNLALWRYPIWTWHHSTPARLADEAWGRVLLDAAAMQAKANALNCFTSQIRPIGRQPIVPHHVLQYFARPFEAFLL